MPLKAPIHIAGLGAVTSIGATTSVAASAYRCELARMTLFPEGDVAEELTTHVARVSTFESKSTGSRADAFLRCALEQACLPMAGKRPFAARVWVACPSRLDVWSGLADWLTLRVGVAPDQLERAGSSGSAAISALEQARIALEKNEIEIAVVAAVDIRASESAVAKALLSGRAVGPDRPWGFVSGEGAAAVMLVGDRSRRRLHLPTKSSVLSIGLGKEPNPFGSPKPCTGTGLTAAIQNSLRALPANVPIDFVVSDLNGERPRSDEWGFTATRFMNRIDKSEHLTPTAGWGDCGAANGLLQLALAASSGSMEPTEKLGLVYTTSDGDDRAAVLIRTIPTSGAQTKQAALPEWAARLDNEVFTELADELGFRYGQRLYQIQTIAEEASTSWQPIERIEAITDRIGGALAIEGERVCDILEAAADGAEPAAIYSAVRVMLEGGFVERAVQAGRRHVQAGPPAEEAIAAATLHARIPGEMVAFLTKLLLSSQQSLAIIGLELAAAHHLPVAAETIATIAATIQPEGELSFVKALGRLRSKEAFAWLPKWLRSPLAEIRREAAFAELLIGGVAAADTIIREAATDAALLLPASLVVDGRSADRMLAHASATNGPEATLALGLTGSIGAIPVLLRKLDDPSQANAAAVALELLTGAQPMIQLEAPGDDPAAPPEVTTRRSARSSDWSSITAVLAVPPSNGRRVRAGELATTESAIRLMDRPGLPPEVRRCLGIDVALRTGPRIPFDPTAFRRTQLAWFENARTAPSPSPGSWRTTT